MDWKVGLERKKSGIDVENSNTDTYSSDITGEWEISKHFRLSFGEWRERHPEPRRPRQRTDELSGEISQLVINF